MRNDGQERERGKERGREEMRLVAEKHGKPFSPADHNEWRGCEFNFEIFLILIFSASVHLPAMNLFLFGLDGREGGGDRS